jgi:hypothetical protein
LQVIKLGDKEVDYNTDFQLYMQTKLSNPHYIPEVQAQVSATRRAVSQRPNVRWAAAELTMMRGGAVHDGELHGDGEGAGGPAAGAGGEQGAP